MDDHFTLQWNDYQNHLMSAFTSLRNDKDFVDLTLSCEGRKISSHKMLLSACSPYFRALLKENPCPHPVVILRQTSYEDLVAVIHFVYNGEVSLHQSRVKSFIKTAKSLKIRGLCEAGDLVEDEEEEDNTRGSGGRSGRKRVKIEEEEEDYGVGWSFDYGAGQHTYKDEGPSNISGGGGMTEGIPNIKQNKRYTQKFRDKWLSDPEFESWLLRNESDPEKAVCTVCRKTMNAKLYDLRHHARSIRHRKNCGLYTEEASQTNSGVSNQEMTIKEPDEIEEEDERLMEDVVDSSKEALLQDPNETREIATVIKHA